MTTTKTEKQKLTLTCIVTGKGRVTNSKYLGAKAARLGVDVNEVVLNYISRPAIKLLRAGKSLDEVRTALGTTGDVKELSADEVASAIRLNGKHRQPAK